MIQGSSLGLLHLYNADSLRVRVKLAPEIARAQVFDSGRGRLRRITQPLRWAEILIANISFILHLLFKVVGKHSHPPVPSLPLCVKKRQAGNLTPLMSENNDALQAQMINRMTQVMVAMRLQGGGKLIRLRGRAREGEDLRTQSTRLRCSLRFARLLT